MDAIDGLGPAVAIGQNLLNRNPNSTLATASGLHPFLRLLFATFGERACPSCGTAVLSLSEDRVVAQLLSLAQPQPIDLRVLIAQNVAGSHRSLLSLLSGSFGASALWVDGKPWDARPLNPSATPHGGIPPSRATHTIELHLGSFDLASGPAAFRQAVEQAKQLGAHAMRAIWPQGDQVFTWAPVCHACGTWLADLKPYQFHRSCPNCEGKGCEACAQTGIDPAAAATRWQGMRFSELLALSATEARSCFARVERPVPASRLLSEIASRLDALVRVGLG